jgi:hypothetical protein
MKFRLRSSESEFVIPAEAGIQNLYLPLSKGGDEEGVDSGSRWLAPAYPE